MKKLAIISIVLLLAGIGLALGQTGQLACSAHCPNAGCGAAGGCQACCGANCIACCGSVGGSIAQNASVTSACVSHCPISGCGAAGGCQACCGTNCAACCGVASS